MGHIRRLSAALMTGALLVTGLGVDAAHADARDVAFNGKAPESSVTYDGKTYRCADDAITARSAPINFLVNTNPPIYAARAKIELRYSQACRTVWARVQVDSQGYGKIELMRLWRSDGVNSLDLPGEQTWRCSSDESSCWGAMLNDAGYTTKAYGLVYDFRSNSKSSATTPAY